MNRIWILVTWTDGLPVTRNFHDGDKAISFYKHATQVRDAAYLYVTDESGRWEAVHLAGW
jgi:hypothetical protein